MTVFQPRRRERVVVSIFERTIADRLLDIGCGDGELSIRIGAACRAEAIYGVDVSPAAVSRSGQRAMTVVRVDVGDDGLPFRDDQFDAVHAGEVVDYLPDPDRLFGEVRRCLRPGGLFVISTPNLASIHNRLALLVGALPLPMRSQFDRHVDGRRQVSPLSTRCSLFTYRALRSVLSAHGFDVLEAIGASGVPRDAPLPVRAVEAATVAWPSLSYRVVLVCRNAADSRPPGDRRGPMTTAGVLPDRWATALGRGPSSSGSRAGRRLSR